MVAGKQGFSWLDYLCASFIHVTSFIVPGNETKICENGDLRLANGTVKNEGRVELCFHNRWGTICDDNWVAKGAQVVCRQVGFPSAGM